MQIQDLRVGYGQGMPHLPPPSWAILIEIMSKCIHRYVQDFQKIQKTHYIYIVSISRSTHTILCCARRLAIPIDGKTCGFHLTLRIILECSMCESLAMLRHLEFADTCSPKLARITECCCLTRASGNC